MQAHAEKHHQEEDEEIELSGPAPIK